MNQNSSTNQAKTIVFVIEALSVGGAEQIVVAMANRFAARGHTVHVVCLAHWGDLASRLDERVKKHVLGKVPGFDMQLPRQLRKLIKSIKPDVVNSHLFTANLWTRLSLVGAGIRIVVTEHSRDEWKSTLYRIADRVLIYFCYRLIAVSQNTAEFYREDIGVPDKKVTVIHNGIETALYARGNGTEIRQQWLARYANQSDTSSCVFVGTVGRLAEAKNHIRLLDSAAYWVTSAPQVRTIIVGDGPQAAAIDSGIRERSLDKHVFRLGARTDVPDVLAAMDIFVLSSDREGHPLSALEAQCAGTPVVLTSAGGSEEAIAKRGGVSGGRLVDRDARGLADAVTVLANNAKVRDAMGRFAKAYALENFDLEQMVDRYAAVLLE